MPRLGPFLIDLVIIEVGVLAQSFADEFAFGLPRRFLLLGHGFFLIRG